MIAKKKINIYDVARIANVSTATVSRVLNNKSSVSPETRRKVQEAIKQLNYRPSAIARGLVLKHTKTVGILATDITAPNYARTACAMERELFQIGYNAILCNTGGSIENNKTYLQMLVNLGVCGIICIGSVFKNTLQETLMLSEFSHVPFVLSHCQIPADNTYSVVIDEMHGVQLCVEHLKEKGHKDILYVKDADTYSGERKKAAFKENMARLGLPITDKSIFNTYRSFEGGIAVVKEILASGTRFSAIIFGDDITAAGGLFALKKAGYKVPQDVAIIGYNNSPSSICCDPQLTTVDNKTDIMGNLSVKLLQTVIEGKETTRLLSVTPELIVREST